MKYCLGKGKFKLSWDIIWVCIVGLSLCLFIWILMGLLGIRCINVKVIKVIVINVGIIIKICFKINENINR